MFLLFLVIKTRFFIIKDYFSTRYSQFRYYHWLDYLEIQITNSQLHMLLRLVDMPSLYPEIKISENLNEELITDSNKNEQHTDDQYRKSTLS